MGCRCGVHGAGQEPSSEAKGRGRCRDDWAERRGGEQAARERPKDRERHLAPSSPGSPSCDESRPPRCAVQAPGGRHRRPARSSPWAAAVGPHDEDFNGQGRRAGRLRGPQEDGDRRISGVNWGVACGPRRVPGGSRGSCSYAPPPGPPPRFPHPLRLLPDCHLMRRPPPARRGRAKPGGNRWGGAWGTGAGREGRGAGRVGPGGDFRHTCHLHPCWTFNSLLPPFLLSP